MEVISYPPGSMDSSQYEEMLLYFGEKDAESLEGAHIYGYRPGQQCIRCGKGQLQKSGRKLHTEIKRVFPLNKQQTIIEELLCNYCGSSFESNFITLK